MEEETITISIKEYNNLKKDSELMRKCEAYGIDNWEGWQMWVNDEDE